MPDDMAAEFRALTELCNGVARTPNNIDAVYICLFRDDDDDVIRAKSSGNKSRGVVDELIEKIVGFEREKFLLDPYISVAYSTKMLGYSFFAIPEGHGHVVVLVSTKPKAPLLKTAVPAVNAEFEKEVKGILAKITGR
jgi:hypothetical protein